MAGSRYGALEAKLIEAWGLFCKQLPNELAAEIERIGILLVEGGGCVSDEATLHVLTHNVDDGEWCYWLENFFRCVDALWELKEQAEQVDELVDELYDELGHEVEE